ncbi:putative transmembrane protein 116-like [Scophthalmus maximus]|uniref:Putative transmembrane protein 116-like n=1 Tax=Scophthalmus maximus TaxID=52904 RepID=A0A2U9AX44_SCOMX|nr:putative transmembrane protein 116-like [Scophthalmus maximus]
MFNSSERNVTGAQDWTQVYDVVRCIQLLMALLSVLGSGSIIVCVMSQRLSRRPELQPLFLLSVSDLLLALCWLIGAALFSEHRNTHCYNLHTVEQVLFMSSFFFTLNYMWDLFRGIREKLHRCLDGHSLQFSNRVSTAGKTTALLCGLVPLLLMTPVFIQGNIRQCQANFSQPYRCLLMDTGALYLTAEHQQPIRACHLLHTYTIAVFLAAFVLTLVGITVFVVKARRIYRRVVTSHGYLGNEQQTSLRVMDRRMLLYPLVFVLCWGPAASLASLRVAKPSACQGQAVVVLYISQAFTSASQGFLNCLVYGWTHTRLRRVGRTGQSRDMDTQTPLLRSQKKKNYQALPRIS